MMHETTNQNNIVRFHWVDVLRGVAALTIVIFHYHHFYLADALDRPSIPSIETFPYASGLTYLYSSFAANAVELFWFISGFVFAHVYLPRPVGAWAFGVARFARLYPLHLATLLYVAGLQSISLQMAGHWQVYINNDLRHFLLQIFMASDWITWSRGLSFNGPIWSVSLEIFVYALFFLSLFVLRRAPIFVSAALCTLCWGMIAFGPESLPLLRLGVFQCAGYFFLGSLLYAVRPDQSAARYSICFAVGFCAAIAGVIFSLETLTIAGISIALVSFAVGLDRAIPAYGIRLSAIGDISYSVYLTHVPLQMTVLLMADLLFDGSRVFAQSYLTLPLYIVTSIVIAYVTYRFFERPAGKAIRAKLLPQ